MNKVAKGDAIAVNPSVLGDPGGRFDDDDDYDDNGLLVCWFDATGELPFHCSSESHVV